jgi:2-succinyl-5-enolpyruvyl-6-hydroxy-3-cyclohexene-1-carboxylate synthase
LAGAYGIPHELVPDWERFIAAIAEVPPPGVRMLELRTDRKRDAATRKRLFMDVAAQLGKGSNPNVCG